ncbi:TRAP transporter small permease [Parvularcula dongshanensis]|uniref:TRAP transporter small permease n=1 Tax=Parvularcula dongshanensis TaxID=1173995 RepID=UPI001C869EDA
MPLGHDDRHLGPYTTGAAARASRLASLGCLWLSGVGLCVITLIILYQVFMRYVLSASPSWSEQAALYILVWTVLIAAAAGVREQFHIRIQAAQDALSPKRRRVAIIAAHAVTGLIGVFLAVYGTQLVTALWAYDIPTLGLPRGSAFLPLPLGGFLIAAFSAEHVLAIRKGLEVEPVWR